MYISHLFEAVCSGGFGVGLVSFPKLLYIKNLNCLSKGDICFNSSLQFTKGVDRPEPERQNAFPMGWAALVRLSGHMNTQDTGAVLHTVFTPCSLPTVSRVNFPFPHAFLFLLESVGFLAQCQGTEAKFQVAGGTFWISPRWSCLCPRSLTEATLADGYTLSHLEISWVDPILW